MNKLFEKIRYALLPIRIVSYKFVAKNVLAFLFSCSFLLVPFSILAQDDVNIVPLIEMLKQGRSQDVKNLIPALTKEHPNDVGIRFINAVFKEDAVEAVSDYKEIVKTFPNSKAAEESAKRLINYYQIVNNPKEADQYIYFLNGNSSATAQVQEIKKINTSLQVQNELEIPKAIIKSKFYIQIGAFGSKPNAEAQLKKAEKAGFKGIVVKESKLFKPRVGPFSSQAEADENLEKLKTKHSIKGFVIEG